jgi:hypothetical protein
MKDMKLASAKGSRGKPPEHKSKKRVVWKPLIVESMEDFVDIEEVTVLHEIL